ncbi:MAG: type II toxin-antitoxin system PemK/MazF family toxin [Candidatus Diapherotrites archaeon CG08_land_8_20_14_0_20_34_12]|nr:MAG: type II toxin-antitoxin system PemK/MazF family toxin [Candidatus Diapherotrites archaeon CG08_land_8_20_14_0_20_34_12]
MQKTYLNFEQGTIVIADILFSEQIGVKRRPVLVISNTAFNQLSDDMLVLKITSADKKTEYDVNLKNEDLEEGKLKTNSFIMTDFIATIQKNLVTEGIGKISDKKLYEVKQKIKELFDL